MKVLLDEQIPVKLKYRFHSRFEVFTVRDLKWLGMKDQQLFSKMEEENFDLFISNDQNLKFQINQERLTFSFIDLNFFSNRYDDLMAIMSKLNEALLLLEKFVGDNKLYIFNREILQQWKKTKDD